jgi:hypothetical protein
MHFGNSSYKALLAMNVDSFLNVEKYADSISMCEEEVNRVRIRTVRKP